MRIYRSFASCLAIAVVASCFAVLLPASPVQAQAQTQTRVNDKDLTALMRNLRDDAKSFRPVFDKAIDKSGIRKTSQAKDARNLSATFEKDTNRMLNQFKKHKEANTSLESVRSSAKELSGLVDTLHLGEQVEQRWTSIRRELHRVEDALGTPGSAPVY
jgi:hypothetical protein